MSDTKTMTHEQSKIVDDINTQLAILDNEGWFDKDQTPYQAGVINGLLITRCRIDGETPASLGIDVPDAWLPHYKRSND